MPRRRTLQRIAHVQQLIATSGSSSVDQSDYDNNLTRRLGPTTDLWTACECDAVNRYSYSYEIGEETLHTLGHLLCTQSLVHPSLKKALTGFCILETFDQLLSRKSILITTSGLACGHHSSPTARSTVAPRLPPPSVRVFVQVFF